MAVEDTEDDSGPSEGVGGAGGISGWSGSPFMAGIGWVMYVVCCGGIAPSPLAIGAVKGVVGHCRHEDSGAVAYASGSIRSSERPWSQVGDGGCRGAERCNARAVIGLHGRNMADKRCGGEMRRQGVVVCVCIGKSAVCVCVGAECCWW